MARTWVGLSTNRYLWTLAEHLEMIEIRDLLKCQFCHFEYSVWHYKCIQSVHISDNKLQANHDASISFSLGSNKGFDKSVQSGFCTISNIRKTLVSSRPSAHVPTILHGGKIDIVHKANSIPSTLLSASYSLHSILFGEKKKFSVRKLHTHTKEELGERNSESATPVSLLPLSLCVRCWSCRASEAAGFETKLL